MKKILLSLSLAVLLFCSCSHNTVSSPEEKSKITITSEKQTEVEVSAEISGQITESTTENRLAYSVTESGISLKMNGKAIQSIELGYSPKDDYISTADFDFDGYKDIFIPFENSYMEGCYYRYDPDTELFESWDKLNEIGYVMEISDDDTLMMIKRSQTGNKNITYKWKNGEISPVTLSYYYYTSNGAAHDFYEYTPDGNTVLFERQLINPDNGAKYKTYTKDELVYFSVEPNGIDVLRNGKILQTIKGDYFNELDLAARKERREIPIDPPQYFDEYDFYVPEDFLDTTDFDFDGYFDLFIPTDHLSSTGVYFRFDPKTELFEEWDELNQIGNNLYVEEKDKYLISYQYDKDRKEFEKCIYQWENAGLVLVSSEHLNGVIR